MYVCSIHSERVVCVLCLDSEQRKASSGDVSAVNQVGHQMAAPFRFQIICFSKGHTHSTHAHTPVLKLCGKIPFSSICRFGSGSSQASQNSGDICRICHCESDPQNPLLTPCYCSGSLKYVHQACLQQWLTASATNSCELCKFPFIMHTKIKPFNEVRTIYLAIHLRIYPSIYLSVCTACQLIYFFLSLSIFRIWHCLASFASIGGSTVAQP